MLMGGIMVMASVMMPGMSQCWRGQKDGKSDDSDVMKYLHDSNPSFVM
jgi:hypothetical protein